MKKLNIKTLSENLSKRAESDISQNNISGISLSVISPDETLYKAHFGTLSANDNTPVNDSVLFRMASMTKPVTAVAIMTLYDKGLIGIDDPVEKYLPRFKDLDIIKLINGNVEKVDKTKTTLTVKHLLTHTSGIADAVCDPHIAKDFPEEAGKTLKGTVDFYSTAGVWFDPGSKQDYSPSGAFDLLARIVEVISGMDYSEFVKKYITEPCGMSDTVFIPSEDQWKRIIPMHSKENGKSCVAEMEAGCAFESVPVSHILGGAGLISSLNDYTAFAKMLLNKGEINGNRVLSEKAVNMISTPQVSEKIMPGSERWGLGVRVITHDNYPFLPVGAFGWSGAYGTHFWVDPVNSIAAVFLKNSRHDGGAGITAKNFEKDVYNGFN